MRKINKILLGLGSLVATTSLPLVTMSCDWWNKVFNPNDKNTKPKIPDPTNPNGNDNGTKPIQKDGYISYRSTNENYLKKNNNYFFRKLTYEPASLTNEVYNNQGWKKYRPKMWMALKEADNMIAKFAALGIYLTNKEYTNDFESASGIWNILRTFANSDATKKGISEGGHFSAKDNETKYQALMRFLNEMDEYLDPTVAFNSLYHDDDYFLYKVIPELQNDKEWYKSKLIYSASTEMPSTYIKNKYLDPLLDKIKKEGKDPFIYNLLKQYTKAMYEGWDKSGISEARNWFINPYSFGSNDFMNNKFPGKQYNMYNHKKGLDELDGNNSYNNYNPLTFTFYQMSRFFLSEKLSFDLYKNLIKWFKAFNNINPKNKQKWSEIENKSKLKNASIDLIKAMVKFLDWHHMLLAEFEDPKDKHNTLADLFAMKSFAGDTVDFEYTYKFAYEFLYEKLVPTMIANGWAMPDEFDNFEKNLIDTNRKDSYIYDYIFKYLNTIFKSKYPDIKLLEKRKNYLNTSQKQFWDKKFLNNVLKHWNYQFNINVDLNEL